MRVLAYLLSSIGFLAVAKLSGQQSDLDAARSRIQEIQSQLQPPISYLGVRLTELDVYRAKTLKLTEERGVEIKNVEEGSPAESAGLRAGDVILSYNGENILGVAQLIRLVRETPVSRKVKLQYWRDGKLLTAAVTIGSPPPRTIETNPASYGANAGTYRDFESLDVPMPMVVWRNPGIGVEFEHLEPQLAEYFGVKGGLLVRLVASGSPANRAGLRPGDVILSVGQKSLSTAHDFTSYMHNQYQAGVSLQVSILRDHKKLELAIVPAGN